MPMKYKTLRPFIAFGKTPDKGELVELTPQQAESLASEGLIEPYEVKIEKPPQREGKKKESSESLPAGLAQPKPTRKSLRKSVTKS